ncbi:alpha/beta hydrolase [Nocardioides fonticola]|uniref:Alpha/beta hydrolase n=1 Tax=Nocardioides fonticola TaxID=450363 RepID=A0ABP7XUE2_9ACTN
MSEEHRDATPGRSTDQPTRVPDVLGGSWTAETIPLADDREGEVVATLVHHPAPEHTGRAVLHVHGFADYFFHTEFAAWWLARGYDFYALDLRKYGRSLRPHQTPNHVDDLGEHDEELDAAWQRIVERDGHRQVVGSAHSTGGLTLPLWLDDRRPPELAGLVLNSPWLDLQGHPLLRTVGTVVIDRLGRRQPMRVIPRDVSGVYGRTLHRDHEGEWDFHLPWKPIESFLVHAGWLAAVRRGHARVHRGLGLSVPTLVLSSDRSSLTTEVDDDARSSDIVLDVEQIRRWSTKISSHVTSIAVPGALHDVVLSRPEVRAEAYRHLAVWCDGVLAATLGASPVRSDGGLGGA